MENNKQLDELAEIIAEEEATEQQEEAKAGEWQPKEEQEQQAAELNTADIIAPLLKITFNMMASVRGQHWAITDDVATEAAGEYGKCIDHYFPDVAAAPWVGAVMVTGMLLAPRIIEDNRINDQEESAKGGENEGGSESPVQTENARD